MQKCCVVKIKAWLVFSPSWRATPPPLAVWAREVPIRRINTSLKYWIWMHLNCQIILATKFCTWNFHQYSQFCSLLFITTESLKFAIWHSHSQKHEAPKINTVSGCLLALGFTLGGAIGIVTIGEVEAYWWPLNWRKNQPPKKLQVRRLALSRTTYSNFLTYILNFIGSVTSLKTIKSLVK